MARHSEYQIRRAVIADAAALATLGERTFRDAFAADNAPEDVAAHLAATYSPTRQAEEIEAPTRTTLVVESSEGELIAFAQLLAGKTPACVTGPAPLELLRFYVTRPYHGRGVAQELMAAVVQAAAAREARTIWLGVWERNPRAIAFYAKCGFRDVGSHPFVLGRDRQIDRIMARSVGGPSHPA